MWRNNIKKLRKERGLTVQEFSEATGIGRSTINSWERGRGVHIPERYYRTLENYFVKPIGEIVWEEKLNLSQINAREWTNEDYETVCHNCSKFVWNGKQASFGKCSFDNKTKRYSDPCSYLEQFSLFYTDEKNSTPFFRSQIKCYCGNCIYYKIRKTMYRCANTQSDNYCYAVPHSAVCRYWEDKSGNTLPECLQNASLEEGVIQKWLAETRKSNKRTKLDVATELNISKEEWESSETGLEAIPINLLIAFASDMGSSFDQIIG